MAGAEYLSCENCGDRMLYMGERWEDYPDLKAYCTHCVDKLNKRIDKLEKRARARR